METLEAPAVAPLRNITPAWESPKTGSEFCTLVISAMIAPSQLTLWLTKLHWSFVPPIIPNPPPETLHAPLVSDAEPAPPGPPMSISLQPGGRSALAEKRIANKHIKAR